VVKLLLKNPGIIKMNFYDLLKLFSKKEKIFEYEDAHPNQSEGKNDNTTLKDSGREEWKQEYELIYLSYILEN
jgi:hypothetical protein